MPQPRVIAGMGWRPDTPDRRDLRFAAMHPRALALPPLAHVDLRVDMPPVLDQGTLGSCTAFAIGSAYQYELAYHGVTPFQPSPLFLYYEERALEGTTGADAGAEIRDGIKVLAAGGICPEPDWPYDVARFAEKPPDEAYIDGALHRALRYMRCDTQSDVLAALSHAHPVVFGFTVYAQFESQEAEQRGWVKLPQPGDRLLGGHAVTAVGYDLREQVLLVRNSWGPHWGLGGYFTMPFSYAFNPDLADDFWALELVS